MAKSNYDKSMEYVSQTQTLIGSQRKRLIDEDTGERIEVEQITKRALGQKQFWKIYLMDFLQVLGGFEYKQLDVLIYILEHTEASTNTFIGTYRGLSEKAGVSFDTVARTVKLLTTKGFLKRVQTGVYQVSPNIMMKGSEHKKSLLLNYCDDAERVERPEPPEQTDAADQRRAGKGVSQNDQRRIAGHANHDGASHGQQAAARP